MAVRHPKGSDLIGLVKRILASQEDLSRLKAKTAALQLGMGSTMLHKLLREAGTAWLSLLREERLKRCRQALSERHDLSDRELAVICGFINMKNLKRDLGRSNIRSLG